MSKEIIKAQSGIRFALYFTGIIWFVEACDYFSAFEFESLGILPRTLKGSIGIVTAPLIHGDVFHLISNTFPIIILVIGVFYFYDKIALWVFFLIYFMTGFWVWIAARDAYHIGASGLVYGLISFLIFSGFIRRDIKTLSISFAVLFLYGGNMFYGLFPGNEGVSWESHLLGFIAGLFCAIYFRPRSIKNDNVLDLSDSQAESIRYEFRYGTNETPEYHVTGKADKKKYYYWIDKDNS